MIIGNIIIAKNVKKNKPINELEEIVIIRKFFISLKKKTHIKFYLRVRIFYNDKSLQITLKEK